MLRQPATRLAPRVFFCRAALWAALLALAALTPQGARADKISHPGAIFTGLDKITGRIISFEVATDETVQFGTLQITERACYTRPATEAPQNAICSRQRGQRFVPGPRFGRLAPGASSRNSPEL